jgi:predicted transcriptional regulator YheO
MTNKNKIYIAAIGAGVAAIAVSSYYEYVHVLRVENAKREKIAEWERENRACTENFTKRMMDYLESDSFSSEEFWTIYKEEMRFLKIVGDQPMY